MRPRVEHIGYPSEGSFACRCSWGVVFDCPWHVHPEVEVLLIEAGTGRSLVGDALGRYGPGDLYLLGPDLPHLFYSDPPAVEATASPDASKSRFVQFRVDCFGKEFFDLKEMRAVRRLIARSRRGLYFGSHSQRNEAVRLLQETFEVSAMRRVASLLNLLGELDTMDARQLAGASFESVATEAGSGATDRRRLAPAIDYIHRHLRDPLDLPGVARLVGLSPSGFSRAFRLAYGRSFTDFVLDLRLGEACRLLGETDQSIVEVCYASGFANLSNFNRQFLKRRGTTPRLFRQSVRAERDGFYRTLR